MTGGILMAIVMVIVVPVGVMLSGAIWTAAIGALFDDGAEPPASPAGS